MNTPSGKQHSNTNNIAERLASVTLDSHEHDSNHIIPQDNDVNGYQGDDDANDDDDDDDEDSNDKKTLKASLI